MLSKSICCKDVRKCLYAGKVLAKVFHSLAVKSILEMSAENITSSILVRKYYCRRCGSLWFIHSIFLLGLFVITLEPVINWFPPADAFWRNSNRRLLKSSRYAKMENLNKWKYNYWIEIKNIRVKGRIAHHLNFFCPAMFSKLLLLPHCFPLYSIITL